MTLLCVTQSAAELAHELRNLLENKATFHLGGANVIDVALDDGASVDADDQTVVSDGSDGPGSSSAFQSSAIFAASVDSATFEAVDPGNGADPCPRCGQHVALYASLCNCGFDMDAWRKKTLMISTAKPWKNKPKSLRTAFAARKLPVRTAKSQKRSSAAVRVFSHA